MTSLKEYKSTIFGLKLISYIKGSDLQLLSKHVTYMLVYVYVYMMMTLF
jgi:hypothetical protein